VSVLVERDRQRMLVVKGSPEDVLRLCANYESRDGGASFPLDGAALLRIRQVYEDLSREGFRVLGIARHDVPADH